MWEALSAAGPSHALHGEGERDPSPTKSSINLMQPRHINCHDFDSQQRVRVKQTGSESGCRYECWHVGCHPVLPHKKDPFIDYIYHSTDGTGTLSLDSSFFGCHRSDYKR